MEIAFQGFPKIARLTRDCVITEKLDGTNAQVFIRPVAEAAYEDNWPVIAHDTTAGLLMFAGSRTRWITPTSDNFGFARWVQANAEELFRLGPGQHFGEWWGQGIQRTYGLTEKRFSLFNSHRWADAAVRPSVCGVVPVLHVGPFDTDAIGSTLETLREHGSQAAPGFMKPEGVVIFHSASGQLFKKTLEKDEQPKGPNGR